MKKFFFRLETLLQVRAMREKSAKHDLEYVAQKCAQIKEKEKTLQIQIETLILEIRGLRMEGKWQAQETYTRILEHLNSTLAQLQYSLAAQEKMRDERKIRLKQIVQERKVVEKIKEKHYAHWSSCCVQEEAAVLDEIHTISRKQTQT